MRSRSKLIFSLLLQGYLYTLARADDQDYLAMVGTTPVTISDIDSMIRPKMFQIRTEEYRVKREALENTIAQMLLEKEAKEQNIDIDELFRREVDLKTRAVTEKEKNEAYEQQKSRFGTQAKEEAVKVLEIELRNQRLNERRVEYSRELRKRAGVRILLDAPRVSVQAGGGASRGPDNAAVTIIEFSDFQCPYCSRAAKTLSDVEEVYGGKLKVVFRNYPLTSIHPLAFKAAEAAACAQEQGKFWPMYDKLFANQSKLEVANLKQYAKDLRLKTDSFNACLDSDKYGQSVRQDMLDGAQYGVTGTPAFFVNGRLLAGSQPVDSFIEVIDQELEKAGLDPWGFQKREEIS